MTVQEARERLVARGWSVERADTLAFAVVHLEDAARALLAAEDRIADLWAGQASGLADWILTDARPPLADTWERRKARFDAAQAADMAELLR